MALDRPFGVGRVQTANAAVCPQKYNSRINLHAQGKTSFYTRISHIQTDETAETGVTDERGRRKIAELHTSGAKRPETWRGGVK